MRETWVLFERFLPRKSTSGLRPGRGPAAHQAVPRRQALVQAQARKSEPSTLKCSSEISSAHSAMATTPPKNSRITLSLNSRSRLAEKLEWSHRFVLTQADEPAEHHVEIEMLDQGPLGANGETGIAAAGPEAALGAIDGRPFGIKGIEGRRHRMQNHIGHYFDTTQRMIRRNPVFDVGVAETDWKTGKWHSWRIPRPSLMPMRLMIFVFLKLGASHVLPLQSNVMQGFFPNRSSDLT